MILTDPEALAQEGGCIAVVGSGPAGLVVALELRRLGFAPVVLESGIDGFAAERQQLAEAEIVDPRRQAPMRLATRRVLGGTSRLWGGRCVAFDDIDFAARPHVPLSGWPLHHDEVRPWYAAACRHLDCGEPVFSAAPPWCGRTGKCRLDLLERWSRSPDLRRRHAVTLRQDERLRVHLGATVTGLEIDAASGRVLALEIVDANRRRLGLRPRAVVLACGGLETTRLLLAVGARQPGLFAASADVLGHCYMGHLSGRIADIVFAEPGADGALDFLLDADGRYVRRRIAVAPEAQLRHALQNFAAFPDNPLLDDPAHRSAVLSLAYLALAAPALGPLLAPEAIRRNYRTRRPHGIRRHAANVVRDLPGGIAQASRYLYRRYVAAPPVPGFFVRNAAARYAFHYHAEQAPNAASRVCLADARDALGVPRLRIDLRYGEADAQSVLRSHAVIDAALQQAGIARLEYHAPPAERLERILEQASDGYHQLGTTRMADDPRRGVVDRNCRVHGTPNLFLASSSVFPTSGQANPTLLLAALAARLADFVAQAAPHLPGD